MASHNFGRSAPRANKSFFSFFSPCAHIADLYFFLFAGDLIFEGVVSRPRLWLWLTFFCLALWRTLVLLDFARHRLGTHAQPGRKAAAATATVAAHCHVSPTATLQIPNTQLGTKHKTKSRPTRAQHFIAAPAQPRKTIGEGFSITANSQLRAARVRLERLTDASTCSRLWVSVCLSVPRAHTRYTNSQQTTAVAARATHTRRSDE